MSKSEIRVYVAGVSWGKGPAPLDSSSGLWGTQQKEAALFPQHTGHRFPWTLGYLLLQPPLRGSSCL